MSNSSIENGLFDEIPSGKKLYFASDFHLGAPNEISSRERELKIIRWLEDVEKDAAGVFLVGDIFDFWFEYNHAIPKGFVRFQGKIAELTDKGIPIIFFTGNHDMWMFDYFPKELGVQIYRNSISFKSGNRQLYVGHGDGLGPGDYTYKKIKKMFDSPFLQWAFNWVHPNIGIWIANTWSKNSRIANDKKGEPFLEEKEWLLQYSREIETQKHHDFYIFGHRHLPLELAVNEKSTYFNLGEWVNQFNYLTFDGNEAQLSVFEG